MDSKGGAQHPPYDISMSGTGDVVMTDVRQTTATLVLGEALEGRFFVRNAAQELIVELYKPRGRRVELAVEAGTYDIRLEREKESLAARTEITDGSRVVLDPRQFGQAPAPEPTARRGDTPPPPPHAVSGRNRLDLVLGMWDLHTVDASALVVSADTAANVMERYCRFAVKLPVAMPPAISSVPFIESLPSTVPA